MSTTNATNQVNTEGYGELVRSLGRKTRKILDKFQKEDYVNSIAKDLRMSFNGVIYHVDLLEEKGLIKKTAKQGGRQFYKITEKGEIVLDKVNVPE